MERKKLKIVITITAITFAIIGGIMIPAHLHSGRYVDVSAEKKVEALSVVPARAVADHKQELFVDHKETVNIVSNNEIEALANVSSLSTESMQTQDSNILSELEENDYDWVQARIQKHRNEIHEDDLEDFRIIMGKLDLGYISAIVNGEIPGDFEQLLREYLLSQLDAREYERSKTLFLLYNHLMYEE